MSINDRNARIHAKAQWNTNPCGEIKNNIGDRRKYFDLVEYERYKQQYWQHEFFDFKQKNSRVLEIGIGLGTDLKQFARSGAMCHGVDITDRHIKLTKENFENDGLKVEIIECDATKIPCPDQYFDTVYSFGVIHHIPNVDAVLDEIFRLLKPGAVFQVAVYNLFSIHTATLFLRALLSGRLFKLGLSGVLSTIEVGADGIHIKPYVKLYSKRMLINLLIKHGFTVGDIVVRQVNFDDNHPLSFLRKFEKFLGWYVAAKAIKPTVTK